MSLLNSQTYILLFYFGLLNSCGSQNENTISINNTNESALIFKENSQISEYIRNIFQDKNGDLWFGTNGDGVAHYDGDSISYFSNAEGFDGRQITGVTEDSEKNIWFATDQGIVKYDMSKNVLGPKRFTNYSDFRFFEGQRFWSVFADQDGNIWGGSVSCIFRFDGNSWEAFELPLPEKVSGEFITKATTWSITDDLEGNIWFSTNGFGAFRFDGQTFTQYSEEDGLTDNSVDHILADRNGNIWFGTRYGGVSRFDGENFMNYTQNDSIGNNEVCVIYEDKEGDIWFSSEGYGVYRYNGVYFRNYAQEQGLGVRAVQTIFEDNKGRFFVGGGGGLYRYDVSAAQENGKAFQNVTKNGPWNY